MDRNVKVVEGGKAALMVSSMDAGMTMEVMTTEAACSGTAPTAVSMPCSASIALVMVVAWELATASRNSDLHGTSVLTCSCIAGGGGDGGGGGTGGGGTGGGGTGGGGTGGGGTGGGGTGGGGTGGGGDGGGSTGGGEGGGGDGSG